MDPLAHNRSRAGASARPRIPLPRAENDTARSIKSYIHKMDRDRTGLSPHQWKKTQPEQPPHQLTISEAPRVVRRRWRWRRRLRLADTSIALKGYNPLRRLQPAFDGSNLAATKLSALPCYRPSARLLPGVFQKLGVQALLQPAPPRTWPSKRIMSPGLSARR